MKCVHWNVTLHRKKFWLDCKVIWFGIDDHQSRQWFAVALFVSSANAQPIYSGPPHQQRPEVASRIQPPSHIRRDAGQWLAYRGQCMSALVCKLQGPIFILSPLIHCLMMFWRSLSFCTHTFTCNHISILSVICQQSLQIAAFLFTVCHVIIVVQDWFTDLNLYR